jgi:hypothetical protein
VIKPLIDYAEFASMAGKSPETIRSWVSRDNQLSDPDARRLPNAGNGKIPLDDVRAYFVARGVRLEDVDAAVASLTTPPRRGKRAESLVTS